MEACTVGRAHLQYYPEYAAIVHRQHHAQTLIPVPHGDSLTYAAAVQHSGGRVLQYCVGYGLRLFVAGCV
jgi:hypothetical protein